MTTSTTMTRQSMTTTDLEVSGFASEQVARLVELRASHNPFREHFSEREYQQLNFLRWRIEHGQVSARD